MITKINVTQEDINAGMLASVHPVFISAKRAGFNVLTITDAAIHLHGHSLHIPKHMTQFVNDYDDGFKVSPVSFEVYTGDMGV